MRDRYRIAPLVILVLGMAFALAGVTGIYLAFGTLGAKFDWENPAQMNRAVGCLDISRTDIRLSHDNIPYVLEINPLPGLNPRESNFPLMAYAAGMKYEDIIDSILMSARMRIRRANN